MIKGDEGWSVELPGGMIQDIVEEYFNAEMYKREVVIVDSKATTNGYMFVVEYKGLKKGEVETITAKVKAQPKVVSK